MRRGSFTLIALLLVALALGGGVWWLGRGSDKNPGLEIGRSVPAGGWGTLKAMAANVRLDEPEDGENAWIKRRELLVKILLKYQPDLIGCQELAPAQGAFLTKELAPWYAYYPRAGVGGEAAANSSQTRAGPGTRGAGVARSGGVGGAAAQLVGAINDSISSLNTLYYRSDRFDIIAGESGLVLPEEPQLPLTENTFFTLAVLKQKGAQINGAIPKEEQTLIAVDIHFRHGDAFAARCATRLREKIAAWLIKFPGSGIVVIGDMNHAKGSAMYEALTQSTSAANTALADSFDYTQKPEPGTTFGTYHGFRGASGNLLPTDLVFFGGALRMLAPLQIIKDHDGARWPSDHFFVMGEFTFSAPQ